MDVSSHIIQVLNYNSFIRFNNWLDDSDGHLNPVFIGEFKHPKGNITAFCKLYDPSKKGLINEIIGYLFTHALNIKQPDTAFIAVLPTKLLPNLTKIAKRPANSWLDEGYNEVLCFCTSRLDGQSAAIHLSSLQYAPKYEIDKLLSIISDDVSRWSQYPAAIALDENIAHCDRHFNNLLRLRKEHYALIDNGRLINQKDEEWDVSMLDVNKNYNDNRILASLKIRSCKKPSDNEIYSAAINYSEYHKNKVNGIEQELNYWLKLLAPNESDALSKFLTERTETISCLLKQRFNLII